MRPRSTCRERNTNNCCIIIVIQPFGHNGHGPKIGELCHLLGGGKLGLHLTQCCQRVEAYLQAKFHLDPSNRLATVHQRYRQTGQDRQTTV